MNINKIIYYNESTGRTELCSNGDVCNISELNIYGRKFTPRHQLEKLILDKKVTYIRFSKGLSSWQKALKLGVRSKFTDRHFTLEFTILKITDEAIFVNCAEKVELTNSNNNGVRETLHYYPCVAKIKFIKHKNYNINGCIGDAAIIIYDVGECAATAYSIPEEISKANLGRFALSIGLSLFVEKNGDWKKIIEDSKKHLKPVSEKLDHAKKENELLKVDNNIKGAETQNLNQEKSRREKSELNNFQLSKDMNRFIDMFNQKFDQKMDQFFNEYTNKYAEPFNKRLDEIGNDVKPISQINERTQRIESKVDEIDKQIRQLSGQIISYQSLVERQIKKADTQDEIERLISGFIDECAERIIEKTRSSSEEEILEQEKLKLVSSLGSNAWNKLDEASRTFLISAKVMYKHLILLNDIIDYSGVCVLVTKALEVELSKRFYTNFLKYLDSRYQKDYTQYPTSLLDQGGKPLSLERFTMGSIAFTLCYIENRHDSLLQKTNNKNKLLEYVKSCIFTSYSQSQIETMLCEYAKSINFIRYKYRNPSAHTNEIRRIDAEECLNLVLDVEKLLKKMLDSFDS